MGRNWTPQQLDAINATNGSILVSAAAGSGKTAVLVERVIRLITRENNPIDVDRLLIVTFTNAAANEMKQRISMVLSQLLKENPFDNNLISQQQKLINADICTIDKFCGNIVREYFYKLDLPTDFVIASDTDIKEIQSDAIDETLDQFYKNSDDDFVKLLENFYYENSDARLKNIVIKISKFLMSQPFPDKWIANTLKTYNEMPFSQSVWGKIILENATISINQAINRTKNQIEIAQTDENLNEKCTPVFETDLEFLELLYKKLTEENWDSIKNTINSYKAKKFPTIKGYTDNPIKISLALSRKSVNDIIKSINNYFLYSDDEGKEQVKELSVLINKLFEIVNKFRQVEYDLKKKKNMFTFSDIEYFAVKLLSTIDENDSVVPSKISKEISNRYDYIMVDEFQDVNEVQDMLFKCVSKNETNIFVVGDVKQSIYGFRQAKPDIFINKKELYNRYNSKTENYPATIILDKNFRSRSDVCNAVNFIFENLMNKATSNMNYTDDDMLNVGANYPQNDNTKFEIDYINKKSFAISSSIELEARFIAKRILELISSGFLVTDGDVQRPVTYGDIAILLRTEKLKASVISNILNQYGIPAYCTKKENLLETTELKIFIDLLRIIDNPTLDIPMLAILYSPMYGFTSDEIAEIKSENRYKDLYSALCQYKGNITKVNDFINDLTEFRTLSMTTEIEKLIEYILEKTAFSSISVVAGSENARANLDMLREKAMEFESNGSKGLSSFLRYIDSLIENDISLNTADGDEDSIINRVNIMTIHHSKGLEFPICFLAGACFKFNTQDLKDDILLDAKCGIGIKVKNGFNRYKTLPRLAIEIEYLKCLKAEELRMLYVALTRAKEKLIILNTQDDISKALSNAQANIVNNSKVSAFSVVSATSMAEWFSLCTVVNPSFNKYRAKYIPDAESVNKEINEKNYWEFNFIEYENQIILDDVESINQIEHTQLFNNLDITRLKKVANFKYKNQILIDMPQKVSASEIAHQQNNSFYEQTLVKPKFLNSESSSTDKGTAHHKFLQYCNFIDSKDNLENEINRLVSCNYLTKKQANCLDYTMIKQFLNSQLINRVVKSNNIMKEERFFAQIKPSIIFDNIDDSVCTKNIIVQGAVDLIFEENKELVIVDYKTDRVKNIETLKNLYSKQLDIYKIAIEYSKEMKVKECIIYSLHLNEYIII